MCVCACVCVRVCVRVCLSVFVCERVNIIKHKLKFKIVFVHSVGSQSFNIRL